MFTQQMVTILGIHPPFQVWKCLCGEFALPLVETPSVVVAYLYDSYQLGEDLGVPDPRHWSQDMCM